MGGIIVIDFIDMNKSEHRQQLYDHMREIMANDRARHNILPLSKFGLMQITRQRVRPALDITTTERCPSCYGKGEVQPSLLFTDTLREKIDYIVSVLGLKNFIMYVHPFVDAYIKKGLFTSLYGKWRRQFGRCFKILPDQSLAYLEYKVFDEKRNELNLHDDKDCGASSSDKKENKAQTRGSDDVNDDKKENSEAKTPSENKKRRKKNKAQNAEKQESATEQYVETTEVAPTDAATENDAKTTEEITADNTAPSQPKPRKPKRAPKAPKADNQEDSASADEIVTNREDNVTAESSEIPEKIRQPKPRRTRRPAQKAENEPTDEETQTGKIKIDLFDMPPALPPADPPSPATDNGQQSNEE